VLEGVFVEINGESKVVNCAGSAEQGSASAAAKMARFRHSSCSR